MTGEEIRSIIEEKLVELKSQLSKDPKSNNTSSDVLQLEPFAITVNDNVLRANISIDTVTISGLSTFTSSDIAINDKSKKVSALLRFPAMRIELFYKVAGFRFDANDTKEMQPYTDKGKVIYAIRGWRTTFSGKVINIVNKTRLEIAGFGMRSHYDFFETQVQSFMHGTEKASAETLDIPRYISSSLMKTSINNVDDRLETIVLDRLDVHEMTTWANIRDPSEGDDGQLLMMESKVSVSRTSRRRQKRQVPCEAGEELDEYVDSLFRFLRRLVRVMEPFNVSVSCLCLADKINFSLPAASQRHRRIGRVQSADFPALWRRHPCLHL